MIGLRYVLPGAIVLAGVILMAFGSEVDLEGGAGIVSAGLAVFGMNWLYRASIEGDREREKEEAARVYLDVHGHWPDESPTARDARPGSKAQVTLYTAVTSKELDAHAHHGERSRTSGLPPAHSPRSRAHSRLTRPPRG